MADENVKVAVRVRPFNQREKDAKSELVVEMTSNQTLLKRAKSNEEPRKFAFDYSYWSHDGFKTDSNGYFSAQSNNYADQKKVFNDLGEGILKNAWAGFNASLFAYGQTGSGKSYSVIGYGANRGIVPILCEEVFKKINDGKTSSTQCEVSFSMLEIYSEVVRDLLTGGNSSGKKKEGLMVREDPKNGFFPQGLKKQLVGNYEDISKLMDEGNASRTIAATNMNATSSRAHTIITITLVQKYKNEAGKEMAKTSVINLVDLAGSERADQTGATGDRLKEGAAINLSLTSLGNVISALAENSSGKNVKVPYRDSVLTKLLMNALGGNSKTIMIAAISPADINFDESLSTLRYADRAKQIKTKAVVNEDPTEKLIRSLQEENAKLKELLSKGGKIDASVPSNDGQVKKALEENEKQMKEMQMSYEEKLAEARKQADNLKSNKIYEKAKTTAHLSNVNMDPSLSDTVNFLLDENGKKIIGNSEKSDIRIRGVGVMDPHATITIEPGKFLLEPSENCKVCRNGKLVIGQIELAHQDRLLFGASQFYTFVDPSKKSAKDVQITYEFAQDEAAKEKGLVSTNPKEMTKEGLQCQAELIDLYPKIEEANYISILLDKKVKFELVAISAEARGESDGKVKPFIIMKNFLTGLEWIWSKEKFLDRLVLMSEMYADYMDDGVVNKEKFKTVDPFFESPDTPTQLGSVIIVLKSFAYMVPSKGDFKIIDLFGRQAGVANIEISPCDKNGKVLTSEDGAHVKDPQVDLLNKNINFIVKINQLTGIDEKYEDIYCQFNIFNDPTTHRTQTVKANGTAVFNFSKKFEYQVTQEVIINDDFSLSGVTHFFILKFLEFMLKKCFFIQIWTEQKHVKANASNKMTTQEFFNREKETADNIMKGKTLEKIVDVEKQKLKDEMKIMAMKEKNMNDTLNNVRKLAEISKQKQVKIQGDFLERLLNATNSAQSASILQEFNTFQSKKPKNIIQEVGDELMEEVNKAVDVVVSDKSKKDTKNDKDVKSTACNIL